MTPGSAPGPGPGPGPAGPGLTRRLVTVPPGVRLAGAAGSGGELWFVVAGDGELDVGDLRGARLDRDTGLWLPPGARYRLRPGPREEFRFDAVALPPAAAPAPPVSQVPPVPPVPPPAPVASDRPRISRLADCEAEVTGDRRFRVLLGPGRGCAAATQFQGEIPPGRAPEHSHPYDEVVRVLAGQGVVHAGGADLPLAPGTCLHLPRGRPHCLENTGRATLVVLGVFHPGGSPAAKLSAGSA